MSWRTELILPKGFRYASADDADMLVELALLASHGAAENYWAEDAAPELTPRQEGARLQAERAERNEWVVFDEGSGPVAGMHGYQVTRAVWPKQEDTSLFAPVLRLEAQAAPSWMLQALATLPSHRRRGIGRKLLEIALDVTKAEGLPKVSLIVGDGNALALPVYHNAGYEQVSREAMHPDDRLAPGSNWLLLSKLA
jgi:ribosomal protein S18 acetylase RimI-like enzyme